MQQRAAADNTAAPRYCDVMHPLTTDMRAAQLRPYFFWDENITTAQLRTVLNDDDHADRARLLGKMLREARDTDVWHFVTPQVAARDLEHIKRIVGRRYGFWRYLIDAWRADGLL